MPYLLCMAIAPGATWLMNACWAAVPGTCVDSAGGLFLVYDGAAGEAGPADVPAEGASRPGIAAVPARWALVAREPRGAVPPRGLAPFCPALPARFEDRA
jgi:hypothetical protein